MPVNFNIYAVFTLIFILTACSAPQNSIERNARNIASQTAGLNFDPNTRPLRADNIRLAKEYLKQFYELGKNDRAAGLSVEQAQQRVLMLRKNISAASHKSTFINHEYDAEQPEKVGKILEVGASATYWDGYYGRP